MSEINEHQPESNPLSAKDVKDQIKTEIKQEIKQEFFHYKRKKYFLIFIVLIIFLLGIGIGFIAGCHYHSHRHIVYEMHGRYQMKMEPRMHPDQPFRTP